MWEISLSTLMEMSDSVADRVLAAKQQVENLKKEVAEARLMKKKDYIGINKMGK